MPKIIYGGGVRTNNIDFIKNIKNIDGIIISKKSLNIKDLKEIYIETKK
jgi:triosephosphate isomerase